MPNSRKQKIAMLNAYIETGDRIAVYRQYNATGDLQESAALLLNDEGIRHKFCGHIVDSATSSTTEDEDFEFGEALKAVVPDVRSIDDERIKTLLEMANIAKQKVRDF